MAWLICCTLTHGEMMKLSVMRQVADALAEKAAVGDVLED